MQKYISNSEAETMALAGEICSRIKPGFLVFFSGEMGAGKTAFVRGALKAYGNPAFVSSPTFALVNDYGGAPHIYHFDMYRITDMDDLYSTGFFDYMNDDSILFVEWSENVRAFTEEYYKDRIIFIDIRKGDDPEERIITVSGGEF